MLTQEERDRIEARLLQERESSIATLEQFEDRPENLQERSGELSLYRFHLADIGTEAQEQEKEFLLASMEGRRLYEIDEALRRLYKTPETFGICERCGKSIGVERLDIIPEARHCADCQRAVEADADAAPVGVPPA